MTIMEMTAGKAAEGSQKLREICAELELEPYERSIGMVLMERARQFGLQPMLLDKGPEGTYQEHTWEACFNEISHVAANLLGSGVLPGDRLAILSENRREMLIWELAAMSIGALSVPIFAGYFPHQIEYIIRDSGAKRLTVSTPLQLMKLAHCKDISQLEAVVLIEHNASELTIGSVGGVPVVPYSQLSAAPAACLLERFFNAVSEVDGSASAFVMYTSGTTGDPKGVELTHSNLLSQQRAIRQLWGLTPGERFLSYLPWHHSFGGLFERFTALYSGATMALDESGGKDIEVLIENWRTIRPTIFFSVPGVYQRLADEIRESIEVRETIFHGELRFVFTAAAPLPRDVSELFTSSGVPVLEGWGLTETSPCVTLTDPKQKRVAGVVGCPIPGVTVRLASDGEIQVRGPNVMRGYYNQPAANREAFTEDGWFRTGDLGELHEDGLRILGRRDGMFKLLNAEKVFAAQIEMALVGGSEYIDQAVVVGTGQNYVAALLYANRRALEEWGGKHGVRVPDGDDIAYVSDIRRLFAHEVQRINNEIAGRYQRVRKFVVLGQPLTLESGELTPTSKVVRNKVVHNRNEIIDALYKPDCPPPMKTIVCLGDCY